MVDKEITQRLRIQIKKKLDLCNQAFTPKICSIIRTKEGYLKIESMIISYMISNNIPIGATITQLETELE